jgi:hypothetical protein
VLHHTDVVLGDVVSHVSGGVDVAESDFVMVSVVDDVDEVCVEGVDVVEFGEVVEDFTEAFVDGFSAEFDLTHVKVANTLDVVAGVDDCGSFSLKFGEDDVD